MLTLAPMSVSAQTFRALDKASADVLVVQSDTLRTLKAEIEQSNVLVMISTISKASIAKDAFRSQVQLLTSTGSNRIVHIRLRVPEPSKARLAAAFAHELQHVVELARAPHITTPDAWAAHLKIIGREGRPGFFETDAALDIERAVLAELVVK
jgi:hypothetical protein